MSENHSLLEQLEKLLSWKRSKKFYAEKLGITEYEVEELMKELKQRGIYIGIGSNMTSDVQYRKILKLGLGKYIDGIVTSEEAGEEKPHRKLFDLCVEKAGVMVEESIFIGDSIAHDVTGAQNIGMPVILYRPKENVNEIEWLQTEKGKCPAIAHFSQFFEAEKML